MMINKITDNITKRKIPVSDIEFISHNEIKINESYILLGKLLNTILNEKYEISNDNDDLVLKDIYIKICTNNDFIDGDNEDNEDNEDEDRDNGDKDNTKKTLTIQDTTSIIIEQIIGNLKITKKRKKTVNNKSLTSSIVSSVTEVSSLVNSLFNNDDKTEKDESEKVIEMIANLIEKFMGNIIIIIKHVDIDIMYENDDDQYENIVKLVCKNINFFNNANFADELNITNFEKHQGEPKLFKYYFIEEIEFINDNDKFGINHHYHSKINNLFITNEFDLFKIDSICISSLGELLAFIDNLNLVLESSGSSDNKFSLKINKLNIESSKFKYDFIINDIVYNYENGKQSFICDKSSLSIENLIIIDLPDGLNIKITKKGINIENIVNINIDIKITRDLILNNIDLIKFIESYCESNHNNDEYDNNIKINNVIHLPNVKMNIYMKDVDNKLNIDSKLRLGNIYIYQYKLNNINQLKYSVDTLLFQSYLCGDKILDMMISPININKSGKYIFWKKNTHIPGIYGSIIKINKTISKLNRDKLNRDKPNSTKLNSDKPNGKSSTISDIKYIDGISLISNCVGSGSVINRYETNNSLNLSSFTIELKNLHIDKIKKLKHFANSILINYNNYNTIIKRKRWNDNKTNNKANNKNSTSLKIKYISITLKFDKTIRLFNICLWNIKYLHDLSLSQLKLNSSSIIINKFIKIKEFALKNNLISINVLFIKDNLAKEYIKHLYYNYKELYYYYNYLIDGINWINSRVNSRVNDGNDSSNKYESMTKMLIKKIKTYIYPSRTNLNNYLSFNINNLQCNKKELSIGNIIISLNELEILNIINLTFNNDYKCDVNEINVLLISECINDSIGLAIEFQNYCTELYNDINYINNIYIAKLIRKCNDDYKCDRMIKSLTEPFDNRKYYEKLVLGIEWDYFENEINNFHYKNDKREFLTVLESRLIYLIKTINIIIVINDINYEMKMIFDDVILSLDKHKNGLGVSGGVSGDDSSDDEQWCNCDKHVSTLCIKNIYSEIFDKKNSIRKKIISRLKNNDNTTVINYRFEDKFDKFIGIPYQSAHNFKLMICQNGGNSSIDININNLELWIHHPFIVALNSYINQINKFWLLFNDLNKFDRFDRSSQVYYDITIYPMKLLFNYHIPLVPILSLEKVISFPLIDKMVVEFNDGIRFMNINLNNKRDVEQLKTQLEQLFNRHFGILILTKNTQPFKIVSKTLNLFNVIIKPTLSILNGDNSSKFKSELDKWYSEIKKDIIRIRKTSNDAIMMC